MESWLFLGLIILLALLAHNNSLLYATLIVAILKLFTPLTSSLMTTLNTKGINWAITFITIAMLIPIATGKIGFAELVACFKNPLGWIAIGCGLLVAIFSRQGVSLIAERPEVTVALVVGTIIGIIFFKGMAAGPIIAGGMTYMVYTLFQFIISK